MNLINVIAAKKQAQGEILAVSICSSSHETEPQSVPGNLVAHINGQTLIPKFFITT